MADKTIAQLTALAAITDLLAAAVWEVQNVGGVAPESRSVTLPQMRAIAQVRAARITTHSERAKVGATAGWVIAAADNMGKLATLPAAQAASTLVIPITGMKVGDVITGFSVNGSVQAAGNTGTLNADLRMLVANAAGAVDSSLGLIAAPVSVIANAIVSSGNATRAGLTHTVIEGESYYVLITSTTGAAVTEEVQSISITVTEN